MPVLIKRTIPVHWPQRVPCRPPQPVRPAQTGQPPGSRTCLARDVWVAVGVQDVEAPDGHGAPVDQVAAALLQVRQVEGVQEEGRLGCQVPERWPRLRSGGFRLWGSGSG